ncbi:regulatory protein RecX [Phytobacter sp. V91]|uniref:regulatory protein RecX n=1 Tax=Phytobacter sp. V91 TaxID=3369425 RepID=UPI003F627642
MKPDELYEHAVSLLARKDYSNGEMRRALHHMTDDGMTVETVIVRLRDSDYLNDQRIAENMVSRFLRKQYGPTRIRQELRQKGIDQEVTEKTIKDCDVDWFQMASDCRIKKFGDDYPSDAREKGRQMRFLQSRGFSMDMIMEAITPQED